MTIETKYEIGQEVWILYDNKAIRQVINCLYITVEMNGGRIRQVVNYDIMFCAGGYKEDVIFETKEDLLKSL